MGWGTGNLGGGASLNFKVKDYATEELLMSATGKDNEIGIITSTPMTGWHFAAEQPEMQAGEVWISTGTASQVAFNALKKGTVMVYPLRAKQMQGGTLVDVTAKSWQDGQWVDWYNGFVVLENGTLHVGEWNNGSTSSQFTNGTINAIQNMATGNSGWISEKIDTTGYKKLLIRGSISNIYLGFNFGLSSSTFAGLTKYDEQVAKLVAFATITTANGNYETYELNLDDLSPGEYYLTIVAIATYDIDYMVLE